MKDKEYEREEQIEVLCKNLLAKGDKRENIIQKLGQPIVKCDTTYALYGTFQKQIPFDNPNLLLKTSEDKYDKLIHTRCNEELKVDRYVVGFNGSGPDYLTLCYDKDNKLSAVLFEKTEY